MLSHATPNLKFYSPDRSQVASSDSGDGTVSIMCDSARSLRSGEPHPAACFERGVTLTGREREVQRKHYIIAARNRHSAFWAEYEKVGDLTDWTTSFIDTLH